MVVVSLIRFSEPLAFTSLFPYLYFMIRDFQVAPTEQEISKYSGYLASSFAFCQFLFAVQWGKLSNRVGRKPVLLCGLLGTSASLLMFGFSTSYFMALFSRLLAGALNGNIAVLRTTIGEICVEKRHQAIGFSTLPLLFNVGAVIGPLIGGLLLFTRPSDKNPYQQKRRPGGREPEVYSAGFRKFYDSFASAHPYALSNIVVLVFLCLSCLIGFLFLEETNETLKNQRDVGLEWGDWLVTRFFGKEMPQRPWKSVHACDAGAEPASPGAAAVLPVGGHIARSPGENSPLLGTASDDALDDELVEDDNAPEGFLPRNLSNAVVRRYSLASVYVPPKEPRALTPRVVLVILSNCIISLHGIAYNEFLPVLLAARFQKDELAFPFKIRGGFGLDSSYIGTLFSSTGIMGMLIILVVFPWIDRTFGTLQGYRFSLLFFPIVYALVPMAIFTLHKYNEHYPRWLTPVVLYSLTSLKTLASATGMPQVMLLNHRAADKKHRAYVNSLTMSMLALARCIGPIVFGYLMTIGDRLGIAWLVWWLMALLALFGLLQSFTMRDYED